MEKRIASERGFNLIELMTTVVIIGIVATLAVPRFQTAFDKINFRSSNRDIMSDLRLARSKAISEKHDFGVYFDPEALTVTLFMKDPDNSSALDYAFETGDVILKVENVSEKIGALYASMYPDNAIVFKPNGSANYSGDGSIVSFLATEHMVGICQMTILKATGRIKSDTYYY